MAVSKKIAASIEKSSWIRKMFEEGNTRKAKYGADNVFDFSLGNPNLEPPAEFKKALIALANDPQPGQHQYMPNAGFAKTRQAVADYLNKFNQARFSADEIVMTVGAGGGLNVVLKTILNPGDQVIIPKPYFVEYNFYLDNHQGQPELVSTRPDFSLDMEKLAAAIGASTRAVLINSPNNPTGRIYREAELAALSSVLQEKSKQFGQPVYLISDEPYRKIAYDGVRVPSIFDFYPESFMVTSFSKDLSLPGERIGYAAAHPAISEKETVLAGMVLCNRVLGYVNAPALMQRAVEGLLEESVDIAAYRKKRDRLYDALSSYGYEIIKPEGAFYLFPQSPTADDVVFVNELQEENILTVPGSGFGGPGHFRISYCVPDEVIEKSLPGFERVMRKYR